MKESIFSHTFLDSLKIKFPLLWGMKIHGHEMQQSDIPDYLFCINGCFVAIEFKVQRDSRISITPGQCRELNKIQNAKGVSLLVCYDEDRNKIYFRTKRIDYKTIFFSKNKPVKSGSIKLDWDFEFSDYKTATELIKVMVEGA